MTYTTIYRLHIFDQDDECLGFTFHTTESKAQSAVAETEVIHRNKVNVEIEPIEFKLSKRGVMELLNKIARHPDNT
jgi:hypothetical protein